MEKISVQDPKVTELSFRVMESIITKVEFNTKEELLNIATEMKEEAKNDKYPEEIKLAYEEAIKKIEGLSFEQLKELRDIIVD